MTFLSVNVNAQYGGSAYVYVKNGDGITFVKNAVVDYYFRNESLAKGELAKGIRLDTGEEYVSAITYSISKIEENNKTKYGGSASVKIRDKDGNIRINNANALCHYRTPAMAMSELKKRLTYNIDEMCITPIMYNIDTCD